MTGTNCLILVLEIAVRLRDDSGSIGSSVQQLTSHRTYCIACLPGDSSLDAQVSGFAVDGQCLLQRRSTNKDRNQLAPEFRLKGRGLAPENLERIEMRKPTCVP
jgi:hypothetical protein